jgi:hypothetical protein
VAAVSALQRLGRPDPDRAPAVDVDVWREEVSSGLIEKRWSCMRKAKVVKYRSSEGAPVGVRWASGPAVKVGKHVVWVRPEGEKKTK